MGTDVKLSYKNFPKHIDRARKLRKQSPKAERLLWNALSAIRKQTKLKFRRQHPLQPYIADFACIEARLIIELDGPSHDRRAVYDAKREIELRSRGWTVLRFSNDQVENNLNGVVLTIANQAKTMLVSPPPTPPVRTGGGAKGPCSTDYQASRHDEVYKISS
jgi:very-short-patch-repair endonuclease